MIRVQTPGGCAADSAGVLLANRGVGGAGGAIALRCAFFTGWVGATGVSAQGGPPGPGVATFPAPSAATFGAGSGGRIALAAPGDAASWSGGWAYPNGAAALAAFNRHVTAGVLPLTQGTGSALSPSPGTVFLKRGDQLYGDLIVANGQALTGPTPLVTTSTNTPVTPSANGSTAWITSALPAEGLYARHLLQVFPAGGSLDPASPTHLPVVLLGNGSMDFVAAQQAFPTANSTYNDRFVYKLDHLDISGGAQVFAGTADIQLVGGCDLHSSNPAQLDVQGSLSGNSLAAQHCTATLMTGLPAGQFVNLFLPP